MWVRDHDRPSTREHMASTGRAVLDIFQDGRSLPVHAPKNVKGGSLGKCDPVHLLKLGGRPPAPDQRGRSLSIRLRATTLIG